MRISDWSSDVCSSDLGQAKAEARIAEPRIAHQVRRVRNRVAVDEAIETVEQHAKDHATHREALAVLVAAQRIDNAEIQVMALPYSAQNDRRRARRLGGKRKSVARGSEGEGRVDLGGAGHV